MPSFHQVRGSSLLFGSVVLQDKVAGEPRGRVWFAGPTSMTGGGGEETVMTSNRVRATNEPASLTAPHHTPPASSRRSRLITSVPLSKTIHLPPTLLLLDGDSYVSSSAGDELLLVPSSRPCPSRCQNTSGGGEPNTGQSNWTDWSI